MSKNSIVTKVISTFVGVMMAVVLTGGAALPAQAQSSTDLQAQITQLLAQIAALQAQLNSQSGGSSSAGISYTFTKNLRLGDSNADVKALQQVLNSNASTQVAVSGGGSPGQETNFFGSLTHSAVVKFQEVYAPEVLALVGLTKGTGFVGPTTRAKLNALATVTPTPPPSDDPSDDDSGSTPGDADDDTPVAGSVTIGSATQPSNSLAPQNAARLPFTRVTFTAGASDVTINSLVVERGGLAEDDAFAGLVLLDENGVQLGVEKTLNSNHRATVGDKFVVKAGSSRTMTLAGNMAASNTTKAGQVATLSLVGVNSGSSVSGSLPITGAAHTINASLSIGSVTLQRGALDPNTDRDKEVGSTNYTFSSIKATAGSVEKVRVMSVRWNQSGSATASDIENLMTVVDGTSYDTVVSSDGKYYTSVFGSNGILVDKGSSIEISIKGDVAGGSARTIAFDVYRNTDLHVMGDLYNYGIAAPTNGSTGLFGSTQPWYNASVVTVSSGSLSAEKDPGVSSQNIAINVSDQPLGGFIIDVKGEAVSVSSMIFELGIGATGGTAADITNITLYDANGVAVAGPADGTDSSGGQVTLSDTVEFPVGRNKYVLKGKIGTDFTNDQTVAASTTASGWGNPQGQETGDTVTPTPSTAVEGNTMTIRAAALSISASPSPVAQTVVAGVTDFTFANLQLDATNSGEDLRMSTVLVDFDAVSVSDATNVNNCKLFDGSTQLNSGSNIVDPTADDDDLAFTLDDPLTITKGTVKTLALKCSIVSGSTGSYTFGYNSSASPTVTGVDSGQSASLTETTGAGQLMTLASGGSLTVVEDPSSPNYRVVQAGTNGNELTVLKLRAANEDISLTRLGLKLTNSASSSPQNLTKVTLHDEDGVQVGEVVFTGSDYTATTTIAQGDFVIPKDTEKTLTIKANLAGIGTAQAGQQGALIAIDYDYISSNLPHTRGVGMASGQAINSTSATDTASSGARVYKAYPVVTRVALASGTKLIAGNDQVLYRFSIQAVGGAVGISKFTFNIATSSATSKPDMVDNINVYAFSDSSFNNPASAQSGNSDGRFLDSDNSLAEHWASGSTDIEVAPQTSAAASSTFQIPSGATRYFQVVGDVNLTAAGTTYAVTTQLQGDAIHVSSSGTMASSSYAYDNDTHNDFLWSPNATTTSELGHLDWANGYGIFSSNNLTGETLSD
ncbi:MAG: peptidoglycan-binding domain-containing protein [bacterium]|nr:peptidoglycan-binding domain-containing protein [bacterium]